MWHAVVVCRARRIVVHRRVLLVVVMVVVMVMVMVMVVADPLLRVWVMC